MKDNKEHRISFRLTQEQYDSIASRANTAQMSVGAYVRAAAMRHKVTVIDGLPEMTRELKGIGRNLNQLTILANEGRISTARLDAVYDELTKNYFMLKELVTKEEH